MDMTLTLAALVSFFALVAAWVAMPSPAAETTDLVTVPAPDLHGAPQAA